MGFRLIPKDVKFFDDFMTMAAQLGKAAKILEEMLGSDPPDFSRAPEIKALEHECDHVTHEIIRRLNQTFVTPIDREDIHSLALALDDVMDVMDAAAALFPLYEIRRLRPGLAGLTRVITAQCEEIHRAMAALDRRTGVMDRAIEINRLEQEADGIYRESVGRLFREEKDPIEIIKWREVYRLLEETTDRAEDVANLVENIVVKHG
ncbi:MAG: DUF47 family protein [Thermoanaerobaculia bacterium]